MGALALDSATLGYGRARVLETVSLEIPAGDFLVIGGPNGGGKTTLLRSLTGLLPLISGRRRADKVRFGYVPQQAAAETPLPMTVMELLELGASAGQPFPYRFGKAERAFHLECLEDCRAGHLARAPVPELSGGQRQRVLLARALALRPNVLILDEPTAGVDRETQEFLERRLRALNREERMTVAIVTHEPAIFEEAARRFLTVDGGGLRLEAGPRAADSTSFDSPRPERSEP